MARKKPRCVLCDASPVIALHEADAWGAFISAYAVVLPETVVSEVHYHSRDEYTDDRVPIDLSGDIASGAIRMVSATTGDLLALHGRLDGTLELHAGESEALALLASHEEFEEHAFCASDKVAIEVACLIGIGERCLSLEELLEAIGHRRTLGHEMKKAYMDEWKRKGSELRVTGTGLRH